MAGGDEDIVIMGAGSAGYGDARFGGRDSYAWVYGVDMESGRAVPAGAYTRVLAQTTFSPVAFMSEWENPDGDPILIWTGGDDAGNATIFEWINGSLSVEDTDQPAFTGGILSRFDQDPTEDADAEMMFFCNGYAKNVLIRRKKDGTTDGGATTTHTAKADLLAVVGADVYRVFHDYKLGILTNRTDPGILGNFPTDAGSTPAGSPSYPINSVLALGASPHVVTGIGLFKYSTAPTSPVFNNVLEFRSPHPDNGKVAITDGRGRIYIATAQGHLVVVTFGFQQTNQPTKLKFFDRSTARGKISALAADLDNVYLSFEPGTAARTQDGMGLTVFLDDGGSFTDITANVTNRKWNSEGSAALLTTGDYIWVGTDSPTMGAPFELAGKRDSETAASALTISYGTVDGGDNAGTYVSATIMDSTLAFTQSGLISFHKDFQHPFDLTSAPWIKTQVNSSTKYWTRIEPNSTLTGVTIREVHVLPYRPPIAPDGNEATDATRMSGYKQAGALPVIVRGHWQGEKLIWHDWQTLWTSKIEKMVIGRVNDGVTDSESALYAVTHDGLYAMPIGPDGDPATAAYPNLGNADTLSAGVNDHMACSSQYNFGVPTTVNQVLIGGDGLQEADEFYVYTHMEHQPQWTAHGPFSHFPVVTKENIGTGKTLQVAWAFKDGARTAMAPYIENIVVPKGQWRSEDEHFEDITEQDIQTPQLL